MKFGNIKDLLLVKKIEHRGKKCNWKNMEPLIKSMGLYDKYKEEVMLCDEWVKYNEMYPKFDPVKNKKYIKKEIRDRINNFLTSHVIDRLVNDGFFNRYKIPCKVGSKGEIKEYYQF